MVLHHRIWLHNIRPDLVSPSNLLLLAADIRLLLQIFLLFEQLQLRLKHLHCLVFVHVLGALILALNDNSGREMGDTDRR